MSGSTLTATRPMICPSGTRRSPPLESLVDVGDRHRPRARGRGVRLGRFGMGRGQRGKVGALPLAQLPVARVLTLSAS